MTFAAVHEWYDRECETHWWLMVPVTLAIIVTPLLAVIGLFKLIGWVK